MKKTVVVKCPHQHYFSQAVTLIPKVWDILTNLQILLKLFAALPQRYQITHQFYGADGPCNLSNWHTVYFDKTASVKHFDFNVQCLQIRAGSLSNDKLIV